MARIRTIKPEFWLHPVMARLDFDVQLLALGMLTMADDHGYFNADPAVIRGTVAPFREDLASVSRGLQRLIEVGWVTVKTHPEMGPMGWVCNWSKHQKVDHPSASKMAPYFLASNSRESRESLALEQGTGNREQGTTTPTPSGQAKKAKRGSAAGSILNTPEALSMFQQAWQAHPRRKDSAGDLRPAGNQAKGAACIQSRLGEGITWPEVLDVEREYLNHPDVKKGFAQNFEVFWGDNGHWFGMVQLVRSARGAA